ncbi:MAG: hypothetical protein IKR48_01220 [Kiritimatiellae bacterium]|nr:hypothetical protein [Kiritimatiellia bacterium]
MKTQMFLIAGLVALTALTGCRTPTTNIDEMNDQAGAIAGFDYRDINRSLAKAVNSMLSVGRLQRTDGGRWLVNVMPIKDDTTSRGRDTGALSGALHTSLCEELTNSGKCLIFNPDVARYAQTSATPQLVLIGEITSRTLFMDNHDRQIEYNLNLHLIETATGVEIWQKRVFIGKRADRNAIY